MEYYHLAMTLRNKTWGVRETANYFDVSIGLVSENIKIAGALIENPELKERKYRKDILIWLNYKKWNESNRRAGNCS
jgi:hypothetical protein